MHFSTHGSGDHVVVGLHGWSGDHRVFDPLAPLVPEGSRLVAFDLPGFGRSETPASFEMSHIGRVVADAINEQSGESLSIITNCSGAYAALSAIPHLKRVPAHLLMIDAFATAPKYFKVFANRRWGHHAYRTTFASAIGRRITNAALGARGDTDSFEDVNHENTLAWLRACVELENVRRYARVCVAATLAYGEKSFGAIRKGIGLWREIWPHIETLELKGAGHNAIGEATNQLAAAAFAHAPQTN